MHQSYPKCSTAHSQSTYSLPNHLASLELAQLVQTDPWLISAAVLKSAMGKTLTMVAKRLMSPRAN